MSTDAPQPEPYKHLSAHLEYPDCSMIDALENSAAAHPDLSALEFFGKRTSFRRFLAAVNRYAAGLSALGVGAEDTFTICMPNTPQAVVLFYALNRLGAIPNMVHPLCAEGELEFYLNTSGSVGILILDAFFPKLARVRGNTPHLRHILAASVADELPVPAKIGFWLTKGRKIPKIPKSAALFWRDFMKGGKDGDIPPVHRAGDDAAAILYSGGTTGTTKGIVLTNLNFNALALQTYTAVDCVEKGDKMLAVMPVFHGFGLGICMHAILLAGCTCVLVPQFNLRSYARLLRTVRPQLIAGVPTLFEALIKYETMKTIDLSCLKGVFSGGDTLPVELKRKVDAFLRGHGASVQVREGYGLTECVTASCLTPKDFHKEGSIGVPYPDTFFKILRPGEEIALPNGEEGEICISGPSVMKEYLNNPDETAQALRRHADGRIWLHTGDLGIIDDDGFVYFRQRIKRMIVSSGYSIYPSQLENIIDAHESVHISCVIGVPDPYKMQTVKAFIVLKPGVAPTDEVKQSVKDHCAKYIAKYAMPREFEYRDSLPLTMVGKVNFLALEKESQA